MDDLYDRADRAKKGSPFLNAALAAHYLGISVRNLQRLNKAGRGPLMRRHGRYVRYHIDDLEAWSKGDSAKGAL
jgi:hypothetical protein